MKMRCALCGQEVDKLQLIESIGPVEGDETTGFTITVCPGKCADNVRAEATVIIRDMPFEWGME